MATIAWLGLGNMGLPMAQRLLLNGHKLKVWSQRSLKAQKILTALNPDLVYLESDLNKLGQDADFLISILPDDSTLQEVFITQQVGYSLNRQSIVIEMSSATPSMMLKLAQYLPAHVQCLDAPVSGGIAAAKEGTLTLMLGGDPQTIAQAKPILDVLATKLQVIGHIGAGKAMKLVNQMLVATTTVAVSEALHLSQKLHLDPEIVYQTLCSSTGNSWVVQNKFLKMAHNDRKLGFKTCLMQKDLHNALQEQALPLASLVAHIYNQLDTTHIEEDFSSVHLTLPRV